MADQAFQLLQSLWQMAGLDETALGTIILSGSEPVVPTVFRVGALAQATIGACALQAARLYHLRTGQEQTVTVAMRAAVAAFSSERYLRVNGEHPGSAWDTLGGYYPSGDGRWVQLHTNFSHHRSGVLELLQCRPEREAVAAALLQWRGEVFAETAADRGLCVALIRSPDEWRAHPQAQAIATLPLFEIIKIGDSDPEPAGDGDRPLQGVRVLDLTRVIAGPVAGRTLASFGAEVMRVGAKHLPTIPLLVMDTGLGKRSTWLDLRQADQRQILQSLVKQSDIFLQGYRPGALAGYGFAPGQLAEWRPGLIYVSLSAFGHCGPWRERRGFDSIVQSASGIVWECSEAAGSETPQALPMQANDHASAYLAAFGALVALARRAQEGGSYLVRVSLAQTAHCLQNLDRIDGLGQTAPALADMQDLLQSSSSVFGELSYIGPPAQLSLTPAYWQQPPVPVGYHPPRWS